MHPHQTVSRIVATAHRLAAEPTSEVHSDDPHQPTRTRTKPEQLSGGAAYDTAMMRQQRRAPMTLDDQTDRLLRALEGMDLTSSDGKVGISVMLAEIERRAPGAILQSASRLELRRVVRGMLSNEQGSLAAS